MKQEKMPKWVLKHKIKGTQIIHINNNFYLYKIKSVWDSKKKRAVKKNEKYLGKITEEGLIASKVQQIEEKYKHITIKEFGASYLLKEYSKDIIENLQEIFPYKWKEIFTSALFRLTEKTHLKNLSFHYHNSYLSEVIKNANLPQKSLGNFFRELGMQRELVVKYTSKFTTASESIAIDMTNIFSHSKNIVSAMLGYNKDHIYIPQVNLILLYSLEKSQPIHFRMVPGSIRDVSILIKTINETTLEDVILIGDKGLNSESNIKVLRDEKMRYVLGVRRDSSLIEYEKIKINEKKGSAFIFQNRIIWFYTSSNEYERIITYVDPQLKAYEESDLLLRIKSLEELSKKKKLLNDENEDLKNYKKKLFEENICTGTLTIRTNLNESEERIFQIMKSRIDIEQSFDALKNCVDTERSFMRDDKQIEGWLFINFIALQMYYKIYAVLLEKNMLNNYSPMDVLTHLKRVSALKTNGDWTLAEIPKKSRQTLKKLGIKEDILLKRG